MRNKLLLVIGALYNLQLLYQLPLMLIPYQNATIQCLSEYLVWQSSYFTCYIILPCVLFKGSGKHCCASYKE
jgi:hypothetical protein